MKRAARVIRIAAGVLLVAAATLAILMFSPARERLRSATTAASEARRALALAEADAVGPGYETALRQFAEDRRARARQIDANRKDLASRLQAWFKDLRTESGATPASDAFRRVYHYNGDQLKVRIRDFAARSNGPVVKEINLLEPGFGEGDIDPATMAQCQRYANIEERLLETASKSGAVPASVLAIAAEDPPADDPDPAFTRYRVAVDLLVGEGRTSAVVHGLLGALDDAGVITRLLGFSEEPVPEADLREGPPAMRLRVTLMLGCLQ